MHERLFYGTVFYSFYDMSYIAAIEIALPDYCHKRDIIASFFQNSTDNEQIKRKIKAVANKSGIETRYSVLADFSNEPKDFVFFPNNASLEPEPSLSQRMAIFKKEAIRLSISAIKKIKNFENIKDSITHVITVTCTGLFAPGLDVEIIQELDLKPSTQRSSINFMGCNAAILALNSAHAICNSVPYSKVLIVCTELCTIHFQKNYSDDYILSTALFGDGCSVVLVDSNQPLLPYIQKIKIKSFNSLLLLKGRDEMAWQLSEKGFVMNLSSYVSQLINGSMKEMIASILTDINTVNYWAIHPGGKRILDDFAAALDLKQEDLKESYETLRDYGNMSSATILFVIKKLIENKQSQHAGKTIFAAAFGPGLSIETMQLSYV